MIQRIQSLWLLLAAIFTFSTFKLPFYNGVKTNAVINDNVTAMENILIMITTIVVGSLCVYTISLYKNRVLQIVFCGIGILLECVLIYLYYKAMQEFQSGNITIWAVLHGLTIMFLFFAIKGIHKDKKIVEDSDRLR